MSGFDDLLARGLPYLAPETVEATQGSKWPVGYYVEDDAGTPVDMRSGFTATFKIVDKSTLSPLISATITFPAAGQVLATMLTAATATVPAGQYFHELAVTRTSDGQTCIFVGAGGAKWNVLGRVS